MAPTRRSRDGLLARVNFPLYTVQMLTSRHVLVGGGGGSSKTGVANGFEIYELSHNGDKYIVEEVIRHETGPTVVMNCATYSDNKNIYLVAGQESHCQLYNVQTLIVNDDIPVETLEENHDLRQRKGKHPDLNKLDKNKNIKRLKFVLKPGDSVQTDFLDGEPLQRVVRICPTGKLLASGGTDGFVRLWQFPSFKNLHTLKAHKQEIDDLDFSPCENYLVSIAKDGLAVLWDRRSGKQIKQLTWPQSDGAKYVYKRCRFGQVEGGDNKTSALYMLSNPVGRVGKQKGFLQKWNPREGQIAKFVAIDESLSALAVRDDGRFVAIGTMFSGTVSIYIAFSLQRALHIPGAHSMFVTGLEFLPVLSAKSGVTSIAEAAVLSISVDNQVCIHSLSYRRTIPVWIAVLVIICTIFLTFVLCSYIGI